MSESVKKLITTTSAAVPNQCKTVLHFVNLALVTREKSHIRVYAMRSSITLHAVYHPVLHPPDQMYTAHNDNNLDGP